MISPKSIRNFKKALQIVIKDLHLCLSFFNYRYTFVYFQKNTIDMLLEIELFNNFREFERSFLWRIELLEPVC